MKTILILANNDNGLYKFRKELLEALVKEHTVYFCVPKGDCIEAITQIGCKYVPCDIDRHGTNPIRELKLLGYYVKIIKKIKPDIVFTYTIKPNVYGGMACRFLHVPYIANITGLGTAIENPGMMQKVTLWLYKCGLKKAQWVFFQNSENREFMIRKGVVKKNHTLLPGSGVNLQEHIFEPYPEETEKITFLVIGRIMRDKGTDELLYAAKKIKQENPNVAIKLIGGYDGDYQEKIQQAEREGIIEHLGYQSNVHAFIKESHATIHASYHEGMANVLLESASCGRPVIATNVPGCRETFDDGVSGISCAPRDGDDLVRAIKQFLSLPYEKKAAMGIAGRNKMEREFDRKIVVSAYMNELNKDK